MRTRVAWSLVGLTCLLAVAQTAALAFGPLPLFSTEALSEGFPLVTVGTLAGSVLGALIVTRYPRHRIGWLFLVGQLGTVLGLTLQAYGPAALAGRYGTYGGGQLASWLGAHLGSGYALALVALLLLLAPDGHLLSPRWRWPLGAACLGLALNATAVLTVDPSSLRLVDGNVETIEPHRLTTMLGAASVVAISVGLAGGALSLVRRLRRSRPDERRQLRWVALAAVGLAVSLPAALAIEILGGPEWVGLAVLMTAYLCVPIFTGIAVLRFRLYDIDVIINRGIVLTTLTGFVAAGYVAAVVAIGEVAGSAAHGAFWPSLLATTVVALAFQPVRRRVTRFADRVVYGAQAAPYEALADFSDGLRENPALTDMLPRVAEAVGRAVGARSTEIRFDVGEASAVRASWPAEATGEPDVVVPALDGGERLGSVGLTTAAGRGLRPEEKRLLVDLATQLAVAFRHERLQAEVTREVERLGEQSERLAASAGRLRAAQAEERRRFEAAIGRDVLPHLQPLPADLAELAHRVRRYGELPADVVDQRIDDVNAALEALRTVTRGVFPAQLAHRGLASALRTHLDKVAAGDALVLGAGVAQRRFGERVESTAYFCTVELLRCLQPPVQGSVDAGDDGLVLEFRGAGALEPDATRHLLDRLDALSGTLTVTEEAGLTTARVAIPLPHPRADAQISRSPSGSTADLVT